MRKLSNKVVNILSLSGLTLFVLFVVLVVHYSESGKPAVLYIFPYAMLAVGICCFIFNLIFTKKAYNMFISLMLMFFGLTSILEILSDFAYTFTQYWPVFGIITGFAWLFSGIYKYRKFNIGYIIPSVFLIILGFWYMLFSFKIIKMQFTKVVVLLGPGYCVLVGLIVIIFYFIQRKNKKLIINNEEPEVFDDEELVVTDLENDKEKLEQLKKEIDGFNLKNN